MVLATSRPWTFGGNRALRTGGMLPAPPSAGVEQEHRNPLQMTRSNRRWMIALMDQLFCNFSGLSALRLESRLQAVPREAIPPVSLVPHLVDLTISTAAAQRPVIAFQSAELMSSLGASQDPPIAPTMDSPR